mmetsp:Transcript_54749/g.169886  ORF Transcript_54749/g.169886 Transcript_54749/m.169886 type:complete len:274 (-) Transcript_54749:156-977(-)
MSSSAWPAASCPASRLLPRKCAQAARTIMRPSWPSSSDSWQSATPSLTTFMPSSSFMETRCVWASMYSASTTSRSSATFLASATASLAASSALSLSLADLFAAAGSSCLSTSSASAVRISSCTTEALSPRSCASTRAWRAASMAACRFLLSTWILAIRCRALASPLTEPFSRKMARASSATSSASGCCSAMLWMLLDVRSARASTFLSPSLTASSFALVAANRASWTSPLARCTSMRMSCAFACSCPAPSSCSKSRTAHSAACRSLSGCCLRK